jgi:hypothetical protein
MDVAEFAAALRTQERAARRALERGCSEDMAAIDGLIAGPLRKARVELEEYTLSLGALEPTFRRNLMREAAEEIALRCRRRAFANADVRFRARFAIYAIALQEAEQRLLARVGDARAGTRMLRAQRRMPLPHLVDDDDSVLPRCEASSATIEQWASELESALREAIAEATERARRRIIRRGSANLARASVRESRARGR